MNYYKILNFNKNIDFNITSTQISNNNTKSFYHTQIISQNIINNNGNISSVKKIYNNNNGNITKKLITSNNNKTRTKYKIKKIE